jgi:hypothetical protein
MGIELHLSLYQTLKPIQTLSHSRLKCSINPVAWMHNSGHASLGSNFCCNSNVLGCLTNTVRIVCAGDCYNLL